MTIDVIIHKWCIQSLQPNLNPPLNRHRTEDEEDSVPVQPEQGKEAGATGSSSSLSSGKTVVIEGQSATGMLTDIFAESLLVDGCTALSRRTASDPTVGNFMNRLVFGMPAPCLFVCLC